MNCNMCGREGRLFNTKVEGTVLQVCEACSRHGEVVSAVRRPLSKKEIKKREESRPVGKEIKPEVIEFIVENYASLIRKGREAMGLKQEDFANKINEKLSVISGMESGRHKPSMELAKKIGRFLRISLVEEIEDKEEERTLKESSFEGFTIGDVIKIRKR